MLIMKRRDQRSVVLCTYAVVGISSCIKPLSSSLPDSSRKVCTHLTTMQEKDKERKEEKKKEERKRRKKKG